MGIPKPLLVALPLVAGVIGWLVLQTREESPSVYEPEIKKIEATAPCPWRDAETDLQRWFPGATGFEPKDYVLTGKREELEGRLGRKLRPEEMLLHCYEVQSNQVVLGTVLTTRIKAAHGSMEIAIALDKGLSIQQLKVQRSREPEGVMTEIGALDLKQAAEQSRLLGRLEMTPEFNRLSADARLISSNILLAAEAVCALYSAGMTNAGPKHH